MYRRFLLLFFFSAGLASLSRGADSVSVKIRKFGLEGVYASRGEPTWVQVEVRDTTSESISFDLVAMEANLENGALPMSEVISLPLTLTSAEVRLVDVPLHVTPHDHGVISVEALGAHNVPLGGTGRRVGPKTDGQVIALLCATPDLCRSIQQSILLSGSPEEQTHKSQILRLIQLAEPPPVWWAYSAANTVVVAAPVSRLSDSQREALEIYLHRGGTLVLIEDQLADGLNTSGRTRFLDAYRTRTTEGKILPVAEGRFSHLSSVLSKDFSVYFRPLGFTPSTPEEIRRQWERNLRGETPGDSIQLNSWLMKRLGTSFRFPSFLELLLWIIGYLLLVGIVNFVVLRRIGRPELGWITIPAIAVFFSFLLYVVSARNHPRNFGLDEMTVYRMDSLSPLAISDSRFRISAPVRSIVRPVLPGDLVRAFRQRDGIDEIEFSIRRAYASVEKIQLGATWETSLPLRRWSFLDLDFEGQRRFAGTIRRDSLGRLCNDTGVNYQQAIVVDSEDVFLLDKFPAGSVVDLGHAPRRPFRQETGRILSNANSYPAPPFSFHHSDRGWSATEEQQRRFETEFHALSTQQFSLLELIRGWSHEGDDVFSETKAVFFGLSDEATFGAALHDLSPDRKAYSLTVVTFGNWP